ncbi:MAG: quinone-dependent dihydroorotate dehydrogenase [Alphaproteobacteria bacterium]|nr:quinone-dependent dihydroorotate dehydrogenase [Alphaproteobacteria bacterium]
MTLPFDVPYQWVKPFFHALDAETAHRLTILALKKGLAPPSKTVHDPRLKVSLWDRQFPNPVGLAAGFDKNADIPGPMLNMGFGFVELGTVTPKPQEGNPRPRIFRCAPHEAVINRMGFPNQGVDVFKSNIAKFLSEKPRPQGLIGINIGMNKNQKDPAKDYCRLIRHLGSYADYFTVNVSSPNTPGLRDLQKREHLLELIKKVKEQRTKSCDKKFPPPILVKLAPDLDEAQQEELAQTAIDAEIDGLILTNTTLARPDDLPEKFKSQTGGLSGAPLRDKSTEIIRSFYKLTKGAIPIIGVGGISSGQEAYAKIKAGASLVQLYSALVYHGPELITQINKDLIALLERDGLESITEAVGAETN